MNSSLQQDFYSVLGVGRDASNRDIKKRFMELARERHPDRFSGTEKEQAESAFQAITEAFRGAVRERRYRWLDYVRTTRRCKLFDFDAGRWLTYREALSG